ncbi:MAG: hypothetical protein ABDK94_02450 [Atribacterota bacterium]
MVLVLMFSFCFSPFVEGKTFCPACPQEKYVPLGTELEKIGVEKKTVEGKDKIWITLKEDGIVREVGVFFFDPEDFGSQRVRSFLWGLQERYEDLRIVEGNIREERVRAIHEALAHLFAVPQKQREQTPCLFINGTVLVGEWEIIKGIEKTLSEGGVTKGKTPGY